MEKLFLERAGRDHRRLVSIEIAPSRKRLVVCQTTGPVETLSPMSSTREFSRELSIEDFLEREVVAGLLAREYRFTKGQGAEVERLGEKLAQDVARIRDSEDARVAIALSRLEALPNVTVTRGVPMSETSIEQLEEAIGVPLPSAYRVFLRMFGSLRAVYAGDGMRAEIWFFGAPLVPADGRFAMLDASRTLKAAFERRSAVVVPERGYELENPHFDASRDVMAPFVSTVEAYESDLRDYNGFPDNSSRRSRTGQIYFFDRLGRVCHCSLRHAGISVVGDDSLQDEFADIVLYCAVLFGDGVCRHLSPGR